MTFFRVLSAVVVGVSALSAGCVAGTDDLGAADDLSGDLPAATEMGGFQGAGGFNKLNPDAFHANKWDLYAATKAPLAVNTTGSPRWTFANNDHINALLATDDGRDVLKYAVQCALPTGSDVYLPEDDAAESAESVHYTGESILTTTVNWMTAPLNTDQADALFACVIAHLNAVGVSVPINLSGPQVINHSVGYDPAFSWEEALWAVKIIDNGDPTDVTFNLYAWPMGNLLACGQSVTGLTTRICAKDQDSCGLTVRGDLDTACTFGVDGWYCNDLSGHALPTILTRLKAANVGTMYSDCVP